MVQSFISITLNISFDYMLPLINVISFVVFLHNFSSSEQNAKGDFPYIFTSRRPKKRTLGKLGKCSVVASHAPLFSQWCYPTQKKFYLMMNPYQTLLKKNHRFKRGKGGPEQENQSPKIESIQSW
jgi:hypothetical protein